MSNQIETKFGLLEPSHTMDGRKRDRKAVEYYESGTLKNIYLENAIEIDTPAGAVSAEFLTFYEGGNLHRVFPLFGKITGYWTEDDEYSLAQEVDIVLPTGSTVTCKPLCLCFYPSGSLKSLTIWQRSPLKIDTPIGPITTILGASFYESGELESIEPLIGTKIQTSIGSATLYDPDSFPLNADNNSLKFDKSGNLIELSTIHDHLLILKHDKIVDVINPPETTSMFFEPVKVLHPLRIRFCPNEISLSTGSGERKYSLDEFTVKLQRFT